MTSLRGGDEGQVSVLMVGFFAILVLLVGVVVDASAAYLQRAGLNSVADGAALAASDAIAGEYVYTHGLGDLAHLNPRVAAGYAEAYLRESGARSKYPGLHAQVSVSNNRVHVHLEAPLDLPLKVPGVAGTAVISADSDAVPLLSR